MTICLHGCSGHVRKQMTTTTEPRAAVEAVVGLTTRGERPDRESIQAWIETSTERGVPSLDFRGRALYFAERMIGGPFRPDGSAPT